MIAVALTLTLTLPLALLGPLQGGQEVPTELPDAATALDARDARFAAPDVQEALAGFLIEGRATFEGIEGTGTFRELGQAGLTHFELVVPGLGLFEQGYDGEHAWDRDPRRGARLGGPEVERQARIRHGLAAGVPWRSLYDSAKVLSRETLEGREVLRIEMTTEGAPPEWWYLDGDEGLIVRHVIQRRTAEGKFDVSTTYGDWRPVEGILIPHRRSTRASSQVIVREVEKVRLSREHPADTFALPASIESFLEARESTPRDPDVVERGEQLVLATRSSTTPDQFGKAKSRMRIALTEHLIKNEAHRTGPYYVRYLGFGENRIDFECGVYVGKELPENDAMATISLPAGPALTVWHEGAYEDMQELYGSLEKELATRDLGRSSPHYELFWVDDVLDPEPTHWRTQIVIPVREREE